MQLKSNKGMLGLTKSINAPSTASTSSASSAVVVPTILSRIERTSSGRFVVKKANSIDDECSSEAISSCSDNDDKLFASKCHHIKASMNDKCHRHESSILYDDDDDGNEEEDGDDENSDDDSDADLMLDNFDVTLVHDDNYESPKNDAERMFLEVVEVLRYEQEVSLYHVNITSLIRRQQQKNHFFLFFSSLSLFCEVEKIQQQQRRRKKLLGRYRTVLCTNHAATGVFVC